MARDRAASTKLLSNPLIALRHYRACDTQTALPSHSIETI